MNPLSVNEALSRLDQLDGQPVVVSGALSFEFENVSLNHVPRSSRHENTYESSIWLSVGCGAIGFNEAVCERWHGKIVIVEGVLHVRDPKMGAGHMGLWPATLLVQDMYRS